MNKLFKFCHHYELPYVSVFYEIIPDVVNEGFYKKQMKPVPVGWKTWTINKCKKYYNEHPSEFIIIDLKNKFCVIDTDAKEQTIKICNFIDKKLNQKQKEKYIKNWTSRGTSNYLSTDAKPIKDCDYKAHFWFILDDIQPKQKVDSNNKIDLITKHIVENINIDINHKAEKYALSFNKYIYKKIFDIKYEETINEPNFIYDDLTYEQKVIYSSLKPRSDGIQASLNRAPKFSQNYFKKIILEYQNKQLDNLEEINEYKAVHLYYYNTYINKLNIKTENIISCYEMYYELFELIDINHIENYNDWIKISFIINSLNLEFNEKVLLFTNISRLSNKYKNQSEYECRKLLIGLKDNLLNKTTIGTVRYWAKTENKDEYKLWMKKWAVGSKSNINDTIICNPSNYWNQIMLNEKYLPEIDIVDGITLIKSHLGTGKTTFITKFINKHLDKNIIIITPREIYAQNICSEINKLGFNFSLYQDYNNQNYNKVVCQVESLHRYKEYKYDIIIMDECESILKQFSSLETNKNNYSTNCDVFYKLILDSSKVIMADAFITNRSKVFVDYFKKTVNYYNNEFNPYNRQCIEHTDYNKFVSKILFDISKGKKICVLWASKNRGLKFIESELFNKYMKNKKYYFYHGDRDKKYNETIKDVNNNWANIDLLMYTTKITVGVNFDKLYFDSIFIYGTPDSACVRDIFQGSLRVRHIKENVLNYYIEEEFTYAKNQTFITSLEEIEDKLNNDKYNIELYKTNKNIDIDFQTMPGWLKDVHIRNIYETNINKTYYKKVFEKYLKICGYKKKEVYKFINMKYKPGEIINSKNYDDIISLLPKEYNKLVNKKSEFYELTTQEKEQINKYEFNLLFDIEQINKDKFPINKLYDSYFVNDTNHKIFYNYINEIKINEELEIFLKDASHMNYAELITNNYLKFKEIKKITQLLNIKNSLDSTEITQNNLNETYKYIQQNYNQLHTIFNIRNRAKSSVITIRNTFEILNKILYAWSSGKLKAIGQKQITCPKLKKRVKIINYKIINSSFNNEFHQYVKFNKKMDVDFIDDGLDAGL